MSGLPIAAGKLRVSENTQVGAIVERVGDPVLIGSFMCGSAEPHDVALGITDASVGMTNRARAARCSMAARSNPKKGQHPHDSVANKAHDAISKHGSFKNGRMVSLRRELLVEPMHWEWVHLNDVWDAEEVFVCREVVFRSQRRDHARAELWCRVGSC